MWEYFNILVDSVDLEHDKYILETEDTIHEYQYASVEEIHLLGDGVLVYFDNAIIKFPYNHLVDRIDGA